MAEDKVPGRKTGIARVLKAFYYSWEGIVATFKSEAAFRQETAIAVVLIPAALYLGKGGLEKAAMIACVLLVLVAELFNSAIEAVVNRFGPEWNTHAKFAKDAGSGAVFITLCNVCIVWALCLFF